MLALTNATLPYVLRLAKYGEHAMADADIRGGVNTYRGFLTYAAVAESQKRLGSRWKSW